jgi:hypothetical protein
MKCKSNRDVGVGSGTTPGVTQTLSQVMLLTIAFNRGRRLSTPAGVPVELASAN